MEDVKSWLTSKGVIGGIIATLSPVLMLVLSFLGFMVTPGDIAEASTLLDTIQAAALSVIAAVGGILAWWGRIAATKKIG